MLRLRYGATGFFPYLDTDARRAPLGFQRVESLFNFAFRSAAVDAFRDHIATWKMLRRIRLAATCDTL